MYFGAKVHERVGVDKRAKVDKGTLVYFSTPGVDESEVAIAVAGVDEGTLVIDLLFSLPSLLAKITWTESRKCAP